MLLEKAIRESLVDELTLSRDLNAEEQVMWAQMKHVHSEGLVCWRNGKLLRRRKRTRVRSNRAAVSF